MWLDTPIGQQLIFVYEQSIKWEPKREKGAPPPECIVCQTRMIRHFWSEREERQRRTGSGDKICVEIEDIPISSFVTRGINCE